MVLPLLFEALDALSDNENLNDEELGIAELIMRCAASARRAAAHEDASERAIGTAVLAFFEANHDRLRLLPGFGSARRIATILNVPALAASVLSGAAKEAPRDVLVGILSNMTKVDFDASVLAWVVHELEQIGHAVTDAGAQILRDGLDDATDTERLAALGEALDATDEVLRRSAVDALRERFGIRVPRPSFACAGETPGVVTVTEDDWFVVDALKQATTVRWPRHPFHEKDEVILVDRSNRNIPREVRGTGDKAEHCATFDERGRKL